MQKGYHPREGVWKCFLHNYDKKEYSTPLDIALTVQLANSIQSSAKRAHESQPPSWTHLRARTGIHSVEFEMVTSQLRRLAVDAP